VRTLVFLGFLLAGCGGAQPVQDNPSAPSGGVRPATPDAAGKSPANSATATPTGAVHPCMIQDGKAVAFKLKALGTEPFWAAEVEGRCVTYRTPEDQHGTRVWTQIAHEPGATVWNGALDDREFQLTVKEGAGCSDGMSDLTYPMDVVLRVRGQTRSGCAAPVPDRP
jgi:uncharacterized membrane protein